MKSKEQKRAEAIERAKGRYAGAGGPYLRRLYTEEEYLDLFRGKVAIQRAQADAEEAAYQNSREKLRQEMGL